MSVSNCGPDFAQVALTESAGCSGCVQRSVCRPDDTEVRLERNILGTAVGGMRTGQKLRLEVDAGALLRMSCMAYLIPACLVLTGAWFAGSLPGESQELAALCGGIAGLWAGGKLLQRFNVDSGAVRVVAGSGIRRSDASAG